MNSVDNRKTVGVVSEGVSILFGNDHETAHDSKTRRKQSMRMKAFIVIVFFYFCSVSAFAQEGTTIIQGVVQLQNELDHSGTLVSITTVSVPDIATGGLLFLSLIACFLLIRRQRQVARTGIIVLLLLLVFHSGGILADLVVLTDHHGSYSLSNTDGSAFYAGTYLLTYEHAGYFSKSLSIQITGASGVQQVPLLTLVPLYSPGSVYSIDPIVDRLIFIPGTGAGGYTQGSPTNEACKNESESAFTHVLGHYIAVMESEVTRRMWKRLKEAGSELPDDPTRLDYGPSLDHPVTNLTWYEAILFANLLSLQSDLTRCYYLDRSFVSPINAMNYQTDAVFCDFSASGYRLLTEGEWEYCCRAGTQTPFSTGAASYTQSSCRLCNPGSHPALESIMVFCGNSSGGAETVMSRLPNPWNLHDMHGNVGEWCWDFYPVLPIESVPTYYPSGTVQDYTGPQTGVFRIGRGGSWNDRPRNCRSAVRGNISPGVRLYYMGFRLARTLTEIER